MHTVLDNFIKNKFKIFQKNVQPEILLMETLSYCNAMKTLC